MRRQFGSKVDWATWTHKAAAEQRWFGFSEEVARAEAVKARERLKLRLAWVRERFALSCEMEDRAGDAYAAMCEARPEIDWDSPDAPELPAPPEEAIAEAIRAELMAAVEEDRWPRHLCFHYV